MVTRPLRHPGPVLVAPRLYAEVAASFTLTCFGLARGKAFFELNGVFGGGYSRSAAGWTNLGVLSLIFLPNGAYAHLFGVHLLPIRSARSPLTSGFCLRAGGSSEGGVLGAFTTGLAVLIDAAPLLFAWAEVDDIATSFAATIVA